MGRVDTQMSLEENAHLKVKNEIESVESELRYLEVCMSKAKGLIALASSFLEKGEDSEAMNLVTLARFEIARISALISKQEPHREKKTISYMISNLNDSEEAMWVSQSERVIFVHALESLVDELDLQMHIQTDPSGVMFISLRKKDRELAHLERALETERTRIRITVKVICDDTLIFEAIFNSLKHRLTELSRYMTELYSDPVVPPGDRETILARLKERERADVEEILVLHSDGRLMCHISSLQTEDVDYDILGSMILALQSFVQDSFQKRFEELVFSGKRILIVPGKDVNVALVIRGEPSERFKKMVQDTILTMETNLGSKITRWSGEMAIAKDIAPYLEIYIAGGAPPVGGDHPDRV